MQSPNAANNGQAQTNASSKNSLAADLGKSALTRETIQAAGIHQARPADIPDLLRLRHNGYVIPYRELNGTLIAASEFQRVRLIPPATDAKGKQTKYLQPANSQTHAYVPPKSLQPNAQSGQVWYENQATPLIITEGEKKALSCAQFMAPLGYATIALGGVNSWHCRTVKVQDAELLPQKNYTLIKTNEDTQIQELEELVIPELIGIKWEGREVFIIFDRDVKYNPNVQLSCFELAVWLDFRGAIVQQVFLPQDKPDEKVGLDDYLYKLLHQSKTLNPNASESHLHSIVAKQLDNWIRNPPRNYPNTSAGQWLFPSPPAPKQWIQKQLNSTAQRGTSVRQSHLKVAKAAIAALDQQGRRFQSEDLTYYYFDNETKVLHDFRWDANEIRQLRLSTFGTLLQHKFGVGTSDSAALGRIADMFASNQPISMVKPRSVSYGHHDEETDTDTFYYQLSDSRVAKVTADNIQLVDNGTDDVLFRSGLVTALDETELASALKKHGIRQLWFHKLHQTNIQAFPLMTLEETYAFLATLFHLSPWLRRWRGMMLPLELCISEANSGKSFLYNLRKMVFTGNPSLDSAPNDIKDFYAAVSKKPFWVADNLGILHKDLRDALSDEMARLITDPDPSSELRQLYTTNTALRTPIDAVFAATAIINPMTKPDILQRAVTFNMRAIPAEKRDGTWYTREEARRAEWIAEHLVATKRFFKLAESHWKKNRLSRHRLVNFEQSVLLMGIALKFDAQMMKSIIEKLQKVVQVTIAEQDPTIEALKAFRDELVAEHKHEATITEVISWTEGVDSPYGNLRTMQSVVTLGRYINSHAYDVAESAGLLVEKRNNATILRINGSYQPNHVLQQPVPEKKGA